MCHDDQVVALPACPACGTLTHPDCRHEAGRCPTLGCAGVALRVSPPSAASNAWSLALGAVYLAILTAAVSIVHGSFWRAPDLLPF